MTYVLDTSIVNVLNIKSGHFNHFSTRNAYLQCRRFSNYSLCELYGVPVRCAELRERLVGRAFSNKRVFSKMIDDMCCRSVGMEVVFVSIGLKSALKSATKWADNSKICPQIRKKRPELG